MRPCWTGQRGRRASWTGSAARLHLDVHPLAADLPQARTPLRPPAPVAPEDRSSGHREGRQQHAHLAGPGGGSALPLALLAQHTGAATTDAGRIHHAQAPIGFSAVLVRNQRLSGWTAQRAIRLAEKVSPRETALFPGLGWFCRSIPLCGGWGVGRLCGRDGKSRSKFGGPHRLRTQVMPQIQAIFDTASCPTVLALHPHRFVPLFEKARFVDDDHGLRSRKRFPEVCTQGISHLATISFRSV
jgi:hypothetical protein